jgi:hypothetical protein
MLESLQSADINIRDLVFAEPVRDATLGELTEDYVRAMGHDLVATTLEIVEQAVLAATEDVLGDASYDLQWPPAGVAPPNTISATVDGILAAARFPYEWHGRVESEILHAVGCALGDPTGGRRPWSRRGLFDNNDPLPEIRAF